MEKFDYIIVGAGSAGCVLANRLSADTANKICLIEAGGSDKSPFVYTPLGIIATLQWGKYNWKYNARNQSVMNNREIYCPRGKTLGGSSSINAMLYVRGHKDDYDNWSALGNEGWSYNDVLPYFKKAQHQERGESDYHGINGPLNVAEPRSKHQISEAFIKGAEQIGETVTTDFNGAEQEGIGWFQVTQKNGERCSAAVAYLHPVMNRTNLTVLTHSQTKKVILDGKKAIGIEIIRKEGSHKLLADKEVILSAGAFGSPQILMLSGIGAESKLKPHGIKVQHELKGVGENLQEHVDCLVVARDKSTTSMAVGRPKGFAKSVIEAGKYVLQRTGFLTTTIAEAGGFIKSSSEVERPDLQLHISPLTVEDHGRTWSHNFRYGLSAHVCVLRPESVGSVSLASSDPEEDPIIDLNMLSAQKDMDVLVKGVRKLREILTAPAMTPYTGSEIAPGDHVQTDKELEDSIREKANHVYHPVGTCKMGCDELAVVDNQLKVHGLEGLRVVDASIMPKLISGNTNAPTIMIGEKAADMILSSEIASRTTIAEQAYKITSKEDTLD
ncbi:GMC family oxidoreductase [Endozoicomonas sp. (ex Bugula neritina AB1)]|nr:GMC family oxidoreductase [Endozoicomonas sp. (ex Bugula neritina AB1)]